MSARCGSSVARWRTGSGRFSGRLIAWGQRDIAGEQFDVMIYDHQHLLVEIAASVGRTIGTRLERKRRLYEQRTGVRPARVILATGWIHSRRAQQLRENGIEVIEPEESDQELIK